MDKNDIFKINKNNYQSLYSKDEAFLRYPADWVIRFHNMFMKEHLPTGKILDYGCGSANNSIFFIRYGYDVYGVDVAENTKELIERNFEFHHIDKKLLNKFSIIPPDNIKLPFEDNTFDFIISNQVLYYLPSEEHIKRVLKELKRCIKPSGVVFFTVMGPKNYYMTEKTIRIHDGKIHEVEINVPNHRLYGLKEMIYLVETEDELKDLFSDFKCITTGYFDQRMFDVTSNFHWIFVGRNEIN